MSRENSSNNGNSHQVIQLDDIDKNILRALQQDGKASLQEIVTQFEKKNIKTNVSTVKRHIDRLKDQGVIKDYIAVVDCCKVGYHEMLIFSVRINAREPIQKILDNLNNIPEINCIYNVSGNFPILCMAKCLEKDDQIRLLEDIKKINGIEEIVTQVVLKRVKEDMRVKIP